MIWIDDNIKRKLHEGIGDIRPPDVIVVQQAGFAPDRYPNGFTLKDVRWLYKEYLPRLVLGCLTHRLMCEPSQVPPAGPYAKSFAEHMLTRRKPTVRDRREWARAAIDRIDLMKEIWSGPPFNSNPAGYLLADFATDELDINRGGCQDIIDAVVRKPTANIDQLCKNNSLPVGHNAGAYIAQVVADLQKYIELMELWPYIIRTIDFVRRDPPTVLQWLVKDVI
ncbi:hypothetical protein HYR99_10520 [Candidatus Poribacteria bacterium]|nr:hypothetical protein [Candidatus Poribacteria bacterium]